MSMKDKFADFLGIDVKDFEAPEVSQADRIEAQVLYTALLTDTLLEEEEE